MIQVICLEGKFDIDVDFYFERFFRKLVFAPIIILPCLSYLTALSLVQNDE